MPTPTSKNKDDASRNRPRPVLMIPLRRCGSNALRLRLNINPKFYSPHPLHVVDIMPLVPFYGDLNKDENYFKLVVDIVGLQTSGIVKWEDIVFDPIQVFDAIRNEPRSVHRIIWEMLFRAGERRQATVVMDKAVDSVRYVDDLMAIFPDMLFLNVVRDPRAQVASMNRAIIHEFDTVLNAKTWVEAYRASRSLIRRYPERVLTIRYEDFLSEQEITLRKVCEFFGIQYIAEMMDVANSREASQFAGRSALWESNRLPPIAANVDKFKQQLDMKEIEIIETLTREFMDLYGYERMTPAAATITEATYVGAQQRSRQRKIWAWKELEKTNHTDFTLRRFRADYLQMLKNRLALPESTATGVPPPQNQREMPEIHGERRTDVGDTPGS